MDDLAHTFDLLRRVNNIVINNEPLSHKKIFDRYNVWMFFQSNLFSEIQKFLAHSGSSDKPSLSPRRGMKSFLVSWFAVFVSLSAVFFMMVRRIPVLVCSVDKTSSNFSKSDARMDSVYGALIQKKIRYVEIFHTLLGRTFLSNIAVRRRTALYFEAIDVLGNFLRRNSGETPIRIDWNSVNLDAFTEEERVFVKKLVGKYLGKIPASEFRIKFLRAVFKRSSIKAIFTIDSTRDYNELVVAARMQNIPVNAFQHGRYTKYDVSWIEDIAFTGEIVRPNFLYVWSKFWKDELIHLGTFLKKDEIVVGGLKEPLKSSIYINKLPHGKNDVLTILIPYEISINTKILKKYIDSFLLCPHVAIIFKLRADVDVAKQLNFAGLSDFHHPRFRAVKDTEEALKEADICAGVHSTFLYDVIAYEKPVVILETGSDFGEAMVRNHLAYGLSLPDFTCALLKEIADTPKEILFERKQRLFGKENKLMKDTVASVIDHI